MTLVVKQNNSIDVAKVIAPFDSIWSTDFVDSNRLLVQAAESGQFYKIQNSNYIHWILHEEMPKNWLEGYKQLKGRKVNMEYGKNSTKEYSGPYSEFGGTYQYALAPIPFANLLSPRNLILGNIMDFYYKPRHTLTYHFYANKDEYVEDFINVLELQKTTDLEDRSIYEFALPTPIYIVPNNKLPPNSKLVLTILDIEDIRDIITTFDIIGDMTFIDNERFKGVANNTWTIKMILPFIVTRGIGMVQRSVIERNDLTVLKRLSEMSAMSASICADPFVMRWALANGISANRFVQNNWEIGD